MSRLIDEKKAYPAPGLPEGKIIVGKPMRASYDIADSGWGFPHKLEFLFVNQNSIGPISAPAPFVPGRANEIEVEAFDLFKVGDKVMIYARLWYTVNDSDGIHDLVVLTPPSEAYDVVVSKK